MNTKTLDLPKPVQTQSGIKMRILCTDAPGDYPVICVDDDGTIWRYSLGGTCSWRAAPYMDLINSSEMVEYRCVVECV